MSAQMMSQSKETQAAQSEEMAKQLQDAKVSLSQDFSEYTKQM